MPFDRKHLDSRGFVLPTERNSHRAQIPAVFFLFAAALGRFELPDGKKGKKFVITGAELITVYALLRSKPPSHRWKGSAVEAEMKRLGMGGNRVRVILRFLCIEGWIRYVDLIGPDGRNKGTITEVRFRRLPENEAGRKRLCRIAQDGAMRLFEEDGETEVDWADYPREFLADDLDPDRPYGTEPEPASWKPYTRQPGKRGPGMREPGMREPGMREPSQRSSGNQYKEHLSKDHEPEGTPSFPRSETGEPDSSNFGEGDQTVAEAVSSGSRDSSSNAESADAHVDAAVSSTPGLNLERLTAELVDLGGRAAHSPDDRFRYELFLKNQIVPLLNDPEAPDRWTADAAKAWLCRSMKAHALLAISSDDRWQPNLLRSFGKRCGSYSRDDISRVLLCFDWASTRRPSLSRLIQAETGRGNLKGWEDFKKGFVHKFEHLRLKTRCALDELRYLDGMDDKQAAADFIKEEQTRRSDTLMPAAESHQVYQWLFNRWLRNRNSTDDKEIERREEVKREHHDGIVNLLSGSRRFLAAASSVYYAVGDIWGFDWSEVKGSHLEWVEILNHRAEVFGEAPAEPLLHLIDAPLSWGEEDGGGVDGLGSVPGGLDTPVPGQTAEVTENLPWWALPPTTLKPAAGAIPSPHQPENQPRNS